ncbi:MAG: hypothetical protein IJY44_04295 [Bacteroidaceae bacterium]|nr:hypothetical protein [Bacteroidaceae bacterium]
MKNSLREIRKQDIVNCFYDSYKKLKKSRPFATQDEVIEQAMKSEAPRFYVTFENARRFVSLLSRKKKLPISNTNKLAMYKEIYRRYSQRVEDMDKRYKYIILERIIEEPAPSFYIEEETFRGIVYKTLRNRSRVLN